MLNLYEPQISKIEIRTGTFGQGRQMLWNAPKTTDWNLPQVVVTWLWRRSILKKNPLYIFLDFHPNVLLKFLIGVIVATLPTWIWTTHNAQIIQRIKTQFISLYYPIPYTIYRYHCMGSEQLCPCFTWLWEIMTILSRSLPIWDDMGVC